MKKVAIQGHSTRGKDVIKILESLGGTNNVGLEGNNSEAFYWIDEDYMIRCNFYSCIPKEYEFHILEGYEQRFLNNMEKRNISIDLNIAREWYKQGGDLRKIALQAFSEKELQPLPKSWEEYCKINPYLTKDKEFFLAPDGTVTNIPHQCYRRVDFTLSMSSKKRAEQFVVLCKLIQIRDYYNQGWEPDWNDYIEDKYCITIHKNNIINIKSWHSGHIFAFKTKELRDEFFQNFKEDLEFIKEFL